MIATLAVSGLGPCVDRVVHLDPSGYTEITGPSEVGKSTLIRAAVLALLGVDVDGGALDARAIRDNASRLEVEITTAKGTRVYRSLTRSRSQVRRVTPAGADAITFGSEDELAKHLGSVASKKLGATGRQVHAARLLMAPMSWVALASENSGRPLRELLSQLVPGDVRAEVAALMGDDFEENDPHEERLAVELRKQANAAHDEAQGAAREAKGALAALVEPPPSTDVEQAHRTLDTLARFERYDETLAKYRQAVAVRDAWRARNATLGDAPKDPGPLPEANEARHELARLNAVIERLVNPSPATVPAHVADLQRRLEAARAHLAVLEEAGTSCPTCHRDGRPDAAQALARASDEVIGLQEAALTAEAEASVVAGEAEKKRAKELKDAEKKRDAARRAIQDCETAMARWRVDSEAFIAWRRAAAELHDEPAVPSEPAVVHGKRPTDDEVALAKAAVETAQARAGARAQFDRAKLNAESRLGKANADLGRTTERAAHFERLVEAVRKAPAERAKRQSEVLGDLGPVSFEVTPSGLEVLVDGRPWWLASRGRLVVADLWFRAGLRRAVKMLWCPLFVDDAQAWSGEWPAINDGPVISLRTEPGEFTVRTTRRAA